MHVKARGPHYLGYVPLSLDSFLDISSLLLLPPPSSLSVRAYACHSVLLNLKGQLAGVSSGDKLSLAAWQQAPTEPSCPNPPYFLKQSLNEHRTLFQLDW